MNSTCIFKQQVLPLFETSQPDWLTQARYVARSIAASREFVTIDDVRQVCPPPDGVDPRVMGAVFKGKDWECIGYQKSKRSACHNRPIGQFQIKEDA